MVDKERISQNIIAGTHGFQCKKLPLRLLNINPMLGTATLYIYYLGYP